MPVWNAAAGGCRSRNAERTDTGQRIADDSHFLTYTVLAAAAHLRKVLVGAEIMLGAVADLVCWPIFVIGTDERG